MCGLALVMPTMWILPGHNIVCVPGSGFCLILKIESSLWSRSTQSQLSLVKIARDLGGQITHVNLHIQRSPGHHNMDRSLGLRDRVPGRPNIVLFPLPVESSQHPFLPGGFKLGCPWS